MTKIMLVEDDNNLREIYEARLAAEGFDIVSAQDGEAALALAAKEHPDLVISDVMMPKISGFEMLDILRNTATLRDVKVIMLTALGQAEDSARAGSLGADRYLVKSQVTLEDIVKAAHEVIDGTVPGGEPGSSAPVDYEANPTPVSTPIAVPPAVEAAAVPAESPEPQAVPAPAPTEEPAATVPATDVVAEPVYEAAVPADPEGTIAPAGQPATPIEIVEPTESALEPMTVHDEPSQDDNGVRAEPVQQDDSSAYGPSTDNSDDSTAVAAEPQTADIDEPDSPGAEDSPAPSVDVLAPQAAELAAPSSEEEANMRAQIDTFLVDAGDISASVADAATVDEDSSEASQTDEQLPEESESELDKDESAQDMGELAVQPEEEPGPPPDEPESEYDKDAAAPDMGELSVQPESETPGSPENGDVPTEAEQPTETSRPAFDLPNVPTPTNPAGSAEDAAPVQEPAAAPAVAVPTPAPWASGDKIVNDAVKHMMASAPSSMQPPDPYATPADPETVDPTKPAAQGPSAAPEQPAPQQPRPSYQSGSSSSAHKRVIAPLGLTETKPTIHQLLALEEAKNGARQAGITPQGPQPNPGPQPFSVAPPPGQAPPPPANPYGGQGFDPNSISL